MGIRAEQLWANSSFGMDAMDSPWYRAIFKLQDAFIKASMGFFTGEGLSYIPLPVTTGAVSSPMGLGSDSLPVQVNLNGRDIYLADSMQFLLEYACRFSDTGCFYLMPSFRGEPCDERHLSQFFHNEVEVPGTLDDIMTLAERYVRYLSKEILLHCEAEIASVAGDTSHVVAMAHGLSIPRVTLCEAIDLLVDTPKAIELLPGGLRAITPSGEAELVERFGGCLWVTHFNERIVPFYQASVNGIAMNADLLMGIGETIGAGQRHANARDTIQALERHGVARQPYEWYLRMKELRPLQTSGFGMGMERFLLWLLRHNDIRDCQIVDRMQNSSYEP